MKALQEKFLLGSNAAFDTVTIGRLLGSLISKFDFGDTAGLDYTIDWHMWCMATLKTVNSYALTKCIPILTLPSADAARNLGNAMQCN